MEHMKQKELFFQYYRFSACVDANYDIKESIKDIQQTVQWTLYEHTTINKTVWQQVTDFFLFTIILNTNATMMYNADLGG